MEMQTQHEAGQCPICNDNHRYEPPQANAERIIVAEDDPCIANLIAYNLEQEGYRVSIAADGVEALRQLREAPPDLLVLDLLLPLQSGWQVMREIRAHQGTRLATLPVLIVSALACERLERDLTRLGAQRLLGKPFSVKDLCAVVRELVDETRHPRVRRVNSS
jgi:DNA-binding response OmpR family regulator